ncbi:MAG: transposase [Hymenobacter sp.]
MATLSRGLARRPTSTWVMLDSTVVRAHQHSAGQKSDPATERPGRSRGGMSTKIHACADALGNAVRLRRHRSGQAGDCPQAIGLARTASRRAKVIADTGLR